MSDRDTRERCPLCRYHQLVRARDCGSQAQDANEVALKSYLLFRSGGAAPACTLARVTLHPAPRSNWTSLPAAQRLDSVLLGIGSQTSRNDHQLIRK